MQINLSKNSPVKAFTFGEVSIAMVVCVLFGAAAFATNQRLLVALKSQKETTAATMMLQERMEKFRATSYSNVADKDYVKNSILKFNPASSPTPTPSPPPGGVWTTFSEPPLGNLLETVTVSGYQAASGYTPVPASDYNQWTRDTTTGDKKPHEQNHNDNLAANYDLLKVDILLNWTTSNGRSRSRNISAVFGKGNIGR